MIDNDVVISGRFSNWLCADRAFLCVRRTLDSPVTRDLLNQVVLVSTAATVSKSKAGFCCGAAKASCRNARKVLYDKALSEW
jgi:hypothetical protein